MIVAMTTPSQITACCPALIALRPHLDAATIQAQVQRQIAQGYHLTALVEQEQVPAVAGWRLLEFLAWGRVLYIDDLSTLPEQRGRGYASQLLDWLIDHARAEGCAAVHLDTGYQRHAAHRLYLHKGFVFNAHHAALSLP